jgi:Asp-tRNA(Asn)/Glu-tRNA(Gln) amidotransferase A subunit family amidase
MLQYDLWHASARELGRKLRAGEVSATDLAASLTGPGINPWNRAYWSGGSSSGSAAAVAAGLVGFAIGSETSGSILTPAAFSGVTGLRPTYGRVSRAGAMALCWTLDKLGPMCQSADDCGLVLETIAAEGARAPELRSAADRTDAVHHIQEAYPDVRPGPSLIAAGNLCGLPAVCLPNGFGADGLPTSIAFLGPAFSEASLLRLAVVLQERTDWHRRRPPGS